MRIETFSNLDDFMSAGMEIMQDVCTAEDDAIHIALSGSSTPLPLYKALSRKGDISFDRIKFYQTDERYVPQYHQHSNYMLINQTLIQHISSEFHYFNTSLPIPDALQQYEQKLRGRGKGFDLTILRIGDAGHVASLLPGHPATAETEKLVAHVTMPGRPVEDRLTLTFPAIMQSRKILLLLSGPNRRKLFDAITSTHTTPAELPVKKLFGHYDISLFYCEDQINMEDQML